MTPILLVFAGLVLMWIGGTDSIKEVLQISEIPNAPGYPVIPFPTYAVAALVVTMPILAMKDKPDWAWKYTMLILLMMITVNYEGIVKFANDYKNLKG